MKSEEIIKKILEDNQEEIQSSSKSSADIMQGIEDEKNYDTDINDLISSVNAYLQSDKYESPSSLIAQTDEFKSRTQRLIQKYATEPTNADADTDIRSKADLVASDSDTVNALRKNSSVLDEVSSALAEKATWYNQFADETDYNEKMAQYNEYIQGKADYDKSLKAYKQIDADGLSSLQGEKVASKTDIPMTQKEVFEFAVKYGLSEDLTVDMVHEYGYGKTVYTLTDAEKAVSQAALKAIGTSRETLAQKNSESALNDNGVSAISSMIQTAFEAETGADFFTAIGQIGLEDTMTHDMLRSSNAELEAYNTMVDTNADTCEAVKKIMKAQGFTDSDYKAYISYWTNVNSQGKTQAAFDKLWASMGSLASVLGFATGTAADTIGGFVGTVDLASQKLQELFGEREAINFYSQGQDISNYGDRVTEKTTENMGEVGSFLYQTGRSIASSALSTALSGGYIADTKGTKLAASALSGALLGSSAGVSTARQTYELGFSEDIAMQMGVAAGINECLFETLSIELALGKTQERLARSAMYSNGASRLVKTLGSVTMQAVFEGSEEVATDIGNTIAEYVILGYDNMAITRNANEILASGEADTMSEAYSIALNEQAHDTFLSFLGGALSGGVMGTALSLKTDIGTSSARREYRTYLNTEARKTKDKVKDTYLYKISTDNIGATGIGVIDTQAADIASTYRNVNSSKRANLAYYKALTIAMNSSDTKALTIRIQNEAVGDNKENVAKMISDYFGETVTAEMIAKDEGGVASAYATAAHLKGLASNRVFSDIAENITKQETAINNQNADMMREYNRITEDMAENPDEYRQANVNTDDITDVVLNKHQKRALKWIYRAANAVGGDFRIVYDEQNRADYGNYDTETGVTVINLAGIGNDLKSFRDKVIRPTVSHEVVHQLKDKAKEAYAKLENTVFANLEANGYDTDTLVQNKIAEYASHGKTLTAEQAREEIVAKSCENLFASSEAIAKAMRTMGTKGNAKAFRDAFANAFDKLSRLTERLEKTGSSSDYAILLESQKKTKSSMLKLFEEGVFTAFAGNVKKTSVTEANRAIKEMVRGDTAMENIASSNELDTAYFNAIDSGDTETAERLLVEQAKKNGFIPKKLYHGTKAFGFIKFLLSKMDDGISIFLTDSMEIASTYSGVFGRRTIESAKHPDVWEFPADEIDKDLNSYYNGKFNYGAYNETKYGHLLEDAYGKARDIKNQIGNTDGKISLAQTYLETGIKNADIDAIYNALDILEETDAFDGQIIKNLEKEFELISILKEHFISYADDHFMNFEKEDTASRGNYALYIKDANYLEIDCKGSLWNDITVNMEGFEDAHSTRDISKIAKDKGYDGVIFRSLVDNGGKNVSFIDYDAPADIYIIFDPANVKSADLITYDDNDNVIPLSERFTKNDDLRYNIASSGELDGAGFKSEDIDTETNPDSEDMTFMSYFDSEESQYNDPDVRKAEWQEYLDTIGIDELSAQKEIFNAGKEKYEASIQEKIQKEAEQKEYTGLSKFNYYSHADVKLMMETVGKILSDELKEQAPKLPGRLSLYGSAAIGVRKNILGNMLRDGRITQEQYDKGVSLNEKGKLKMSEKEFAKAFGEDTLKAVKSETRKSIEKEITYERIEKNLYNILNTQIFSSKEYHDNIRKVAKAWLSANGKTKVSTDAVNSLATSIEFIANQAGRMSVVTKLRQKVEQTKEKALNEVNNARMTSRARVNMVRATRALADTLKGRTFENELDAISNAIKGVFIRKNGLYCFDLPNIKKAAQLLSNYISEHYQNGVDELYRDTGINGSDMGAIAELLKIPDEGIEFHLITPQEYMDVVLLIRSTTKMMRGYQRQFINGRWVDLVGDIETNYGVIENAIRSGVRDNPFDDMFATPEAVMKMAFGSVDGTGIESRMHDIVKGERAYSAMLMQYLMPFEELLKKHKGLKNKLTHTTVSVTVQGQTHEMALGEFMSYYDTLKRQQSEGHLLYGAIHVGIEGAKPNSKYIGTTDRVYEPVMEFDEETSIAYLQELLKDAEAILEGLDDDVKEFLKLGEDFMNVTGRNDKMAMDMKLWGSTNIVKGFYFPIRSNDKGSMTFSEPHVDRISANSLSMNKSTIKGASTSIRIEDFYTVVIRHASQLAQYQTLYIPISNLQKWYRTNIGTHGNEKTIAQLVNSTNEKKVDKYLSEFIQDVQGNSSVKTGNLERFLMSGYAISALGFNLSSVMKQEASLFAAIPDLGIGNAVHAMHPSSNILNRTNGNRMTDYSKLAFIRFTDKTYLMKAATQTGTAKVLEGIGEVSMKGLTWGDMYTCQQMWTACQYKVQKQYGYAIGTEENLKEAGELLDEMISKYQDTNNVGTKCAAARGHASVAKVFTMFSSSGLKLYSNFVASCKEVSAYAKMNDKQGQKTAMKKAGKAASSILLSAMWTTLVATAISHAAKKGVPDEDEDKDLAVSMALEYATEVIGTIPAFGEVADVIKNYLEKGSIYDAFEYWAFDSVNGAVELILPYAFGKETVWTNSYEKNMQDLKSLFKLVGTVFGLPVNNLYKYTTMIMAKIDEEFTYRIDSLFKTTGNSDFTLALDKNDNLADTMLNVMIAERTGNSRNKVTSDIGDDALTELERLYRIKTSVLPSSGKTYSYNADSCKAVANLIGADAYKALTDDTTRKGNTYFLGDNARATAVYTLWETYKEYDADEPETHKKLAAYVGAIESDTSLKYSANITVALLKGYIYGLTSVDGSAEGNYKVTSEERKTQYVKYLQSLGISPKTNKVTYAIALLIGNIDTTEAKKYLKKHLDAETLSALGIE